MIRKTIAQRAVSALMAVLLIMTGLILVGPGGALSGIAYAEELEPEALITEIEPFETDIIEETEPNPEVTGEVNAEPDDTFTSEPEPTMTTGYTMTALDLEGNESFSSVIFGTSPYSVNTEWLHYRSDGLVSYSRQMALDNPDGTSHDYVINDWEPGEEKRLRALFANAERIAANYGITGDDKRALIQAAIWAVLSDMVPYNPSIFSIGAPTMDLTSALQAYQLEGKKVPIKKTVKAVAPKYMSEAAMQTLLGQPDTSTHKGLRDQFFMILMYDTGARLQEILTLRICDVTICKTPTITVMGKGMKQRTVPLMQPTVAHFENYFRAFHSEEGLYSQASLFYIMRKGEKRPMSSANVEHFIKKYGESAKSSCPEIPAVVHPHLFRHSRAMHLYQHGMDLSLVSQWLGHSNISSTLVYSYADTEKKRAAIELAMGGSGSSLYENENAMNRFVVEDEDTLKKLYGLR